MPKTHKQQLEDDIVQYLQLPVTSGPVELTLHKAVVAVICYGGLTESECASLLTKDMTSDDSGAIFEYKDGEKRKTFLIPTDTPGYEAIHNYVSVRTGFTNPHFFLHCDVSRFFLRNRKIAVTAVYKIPRSMAVALGTNPAGYSGGTLRRMRACLSQ